MKLKRAKAVKPQNADAIGRNGTMQWFSNGANHTRAFVIVDDAMELQLGAADGLDVSRGVAKKQ